ncbi:NACHT domain-containing protein [Iningainema tapete]|uniref:NACHT domain-containing NTPase n=1 Tax=Iningainema tapete BLCC-T55 TaxID=2748662 RepID=A0A8J7BZ20_9CYAN|nr:NACHT domain-containing NTPase [Iningainema tapete]MBD2776732.1 NACHT domain-containing NTPase [Iningainema tapete BLCC-T55]
MAGRSLQVSEDGIELAQKALTHRCLTQNELAKELKFSRETVSKFFRGKRVDRKYFVEICEKLNLEWDEIAAKPTTQAVQEKKLQESASDLDALVQEVREKRREKIQHQCDTMRMLDISQPVALADIYTDVNILEQLTNQQWRDISDLARGFNPESNDFDRLGLGRVRQKRIPGLDAVSHYSKLMVLGKPGSGKTTFLQWVAIKCNMGEFQPNRVPIFIRLKNFAEDIRRDDSDFRLLNYISEEFCDCGIANKLVIETILNLGEALILLDGLDEVLEKDEKEVVKQIRKFVDKYFKNQFIITCRIATNEYRFQDIGFNEVEVTDFNSGQVEAFAKKWFVAVARNSRKEGEATARRFIENLLENQPIQTLVVTPILLNLICLVFQAKEEFPSKRSKLYEQGLDILLKKWDEHKGIKRDEVYRNLSLEQKIELLTQVAAITFEKSRYFFEQSEVEQYIADYLRTFPNTQTNRLTLKQDSKAVLKSIEAQHGLLVERAMGIYSFSHLTFQEYLTAKKFVDSYDWQNLVNYITEKRWQEVFLLAVSITQHPDKLLQQMKQQVDKLVADQELQQFLKWVNQKALPTQNSCKHASYKPAAVRAYHLARAINFEIPPDYLRNILSPPFDFDITHDPYAILHNLCQFALTYNLADAFDLARISTFNLERAYYLTRIIEPEICYNLSHLMKQLEVPDLDKNIESVGQWWDANGYAWMEKLKAVIIKYRKIGHDWQFSKKQQELLQQYYNANTLLVDCLNNTEVSSQVQDEIEETLLLPIDEIEKCQQRY